MHIVLEFGHGSYFPTKGSDNSEILYVLGFFLTGDVGSSPEIFIELCEEFSDEEDQQNTNQSYIKVINNKVIVGDLFAEDCGDPPCEIELTKENFISIIEQWRSLRKEKPDEILISMDDDGHVELTGFNGNDDTTKKPKPKKKKTPVLEPEIWPKYGLIAHVKKDNYIIQYGAQGDTELIGNLITANEDPEIIRQIQQAIKAKQHNRIRVLYDLCVEVRENILHLSNAIPEEIGIQDFPEEAEIGQENFLEIIQLFENCVSKKIKEMFLYQYEDGHYELIPSSGKECN